MSVFYDQQPYQIQNNDPMGDGRRQMPISGRLLVDGYKNTMNAPQSLGFSQRPISSIFDMKDAIQVHLLTETALADSRQFEVLSQDQVDKLKKQCQYLSQRIEQTTANLALQTKYRDAAINMAKLYEASRNSNEPMSDEAQAHDAEREIAEKRCEELATELFQLEKRQMEPQRRLLEHTSAILQLTHRASHTKQMQQLSMSNPIVPQLVNGMPGSPESLYASSNRNSMTSNQDLFNEVGQMSRGTVNALEIPLKSPIREQTNKLREDLEQLKEDNIRLAQENAALRTAEQKLDGINYAIRDLIIAFNPSENAEYPVQPQSAAAGQLLLDTQLDYLEKGIQMARQEQEYSAGNGGGDNFPDNSENEARLRQINGIVLAMLASAGAAQPPSPGPTGRPLEDEILYLEHAIAIAEKELGPRGSVSVSTTSGNVEGELKMIWDNMQSRAAFMKKDREDRKKQRAEKGLPVDEDDEMEEEDLNEPYSFIAFTSKVQWMAGRVRRLADENIVLKRQIKQQRELNQKADAEEVLRLQGELDNKEDEIGDLRTQLAEVKGHLDGARSEVAQNETMLQAALRDMEEITQAHAVSADESEKTKAIQAELNAAMKKLAELESDNGNLETRAKAAESSRNEAETAKQQAEARLTHSEVQRRELGVKVTAVDGKIASLSSQLAEATTARAAINEALVAKQKEVDMKARQVQEKEDIMESMNLMLAELKTELTIAQAELDGAYGSRAERAKDIAAMKSSLEMQKMQNETEMLRKELATTVKQLEEITNVSISSEKEKLEIEARLDEAEQARIQVESEMQEVRQRLDAEVLANRERMAQLKEAMDAEKLRAPAVAAGGAAKSATMLSEQFRATMREERKKFQEEIREEQVRRRRVEEELQKMRRAAGMARSPLTPNRPLA